MFEKYVKGNENKRSSIKWQYFYFMDQLLPVASTYDRAIADTCFWHNIVRKYIQCMYESAQRRNYITVALIHFMINTFW